MKRSPSRDEILARWSEWTTEPQKLKLPSAPTPFLKYFEEDNRPQTRLDRDFGARRWGVTIGRLREDNIFDYKFVALAHNTLRGAAGGRRAERRVFGRDRLYRAQVNAHAT